MPSRKERPNMRATLAKSRRKTAQVISMWNNLLEKRSVCSVEFFVSKRNVFVSVVRDEFSVLFLKRGLSQEQCTVGTNFHSYFSCISLRRFARRLSTVTNWFEDDLERAEISKSLLLFLVENMVTVYTLATLHSSYRDTCTRNYISSEENGYLNFGLRMGFLLYLFIALFRVYENVTELREYTVFECVRILFAP